MNSIVKNFFYFFSKYILIYIDNSLWNNLLFFFNSLRYNKQFYFLRIKKPKTFNEKILNLKTKKSSHLQSLVADKYRVRQYVKDKIGEDFLVPLIWCSENIDDFNFDIIKKDSVIKLNNGSGNNYFVNNDFNEHKFKLIKRKLKKDFKKDFSIYSRELHYKKIIPRILIEKRLPSPLNDYKFFCSNGTPFIIQVDIDRFTKHERNFYNLDWEQQQIKLRYPNHKKEIPSPNKLDLMVEISRELSSDFKFCRVDLYESSDKVYFGEITLFPGGGVELFETYKMDLEMGNYIDLKTMIK